MTRLRDYRRRVSSESSDEVGQLARDFNAMLDAVEERERALRQSEETARRQLIEIEAIYANAQVGLCVIDTQLRYVRINKQMKEMSGHMSDTLIGHTIEEATPELATVLAPICRQVLRDRRAGRQHRVRQCLACRWSDVATGSATIERCSMSGQHHRRECRNPRHHRR